MTAELIRCIHTFDAEMDDYKMHPKIHTDP